MLSEKTVGFLHGERNQFKNHTSEETAFLIISLKEAAEELPSVSENWCRITAGRIRLSGRCDFMRI